MASLLCSEEDLQTVKIEIGMLSLAILLVIESNCFAKGRIFNDSTSSGSQGAQRTPVTQPNPYTQPAAPATEIAGSYLAANTPNVSGVWAMFLNGARETQKLNIFQSGEQFTASYINGPPHISFKGNIFQNRNGQWMATWTATSSASQYSSNGTCKLESANVFSGNCNDTDGNTYQIRWVKE